MSKDGFFDNMDEALAKERERKSEGDDTPDWDPKEGETLKAVVEKVRYVKTRFGVKPILLVKDVDTNEHVNVWLSRTVLRNEVEDLAPAPGTPIGIRFDGEQEKDDGGSFYMYTVVIPERTQEQIDAGAAHWREAESKQQRRDSRGSRRTAGAAPKTDDLPAPY